MSERTPVTSTVRTTIERTTLTLWITTIAKNRTARTMWISTTAKNRTARTLSITTTAKTTPVISSSPVKPTKEGVYK